MLVSKLRLGHPESECQPHRSCIHSWGPRSENQMETEAMVGLEEKVAQVAMVALDPRPWHLLGTMVELQDRIGFCRELT